MLIEWQNIILGAEGLLCTVAGVEGGAWGARGVARLNGRTMVGVRRGRCCLCAEDGADISPACQARCFRRDLQDVCVWWGWCRAGGDRGGSRWLQTGWGGGQLNSRCSRLNTTRRSDLKQEGRVTAAYRGQKKKKKERDVRDPRRDGRLTKELLLRLSGGG